MKLISKTGICGAVSSSGTIYCFRIGDVQSTAKAKTGVDMKVVCGMVGDMRVVPDMVTQMNDMPGMVLDLVARMKVVADMVNHTKVVTHRSLPHRPALHRRLPPVRDPREWN